MFVVCHLYIVVVLYVYNTFDNIYYYNILYNILLYYIILYMQYNGLNKLWQYRYICKNPCQKKKYLIINFSFLKFSFI